MNVSPLSREFVEGGVFVLSTSGTGDPLVSDLRLFLLQNGARKVVFIRHPFVERTLLASHSREVTLSNGSVKVKRFWRPNFPPFSYIFDLTIPVHTPESIRCWFAFTNLSAVHGRFRRRSHVERVCAWYIDFVPDRFGPRSLATKAYEFLDRWLDKRIDLRVELTAATASLRSERIGHPIAKVAIGPIGQWVSDLECSASGRWETQNIVYLGGLNKRLGAHLIPEMVLQLHARGWRGHFDVIGTGDLDHELKASVKKLQVEDLITFHGYVEDRGTVESYLKRAAIGVAPYTPTPGVFTETTDSAKLKAYAGAGLPIVTTPVTLNCHDLEEAGAAKLVEFDSAMFAYTILTLLADQSTWALMSAASHRYAANFDWNAIFSSTIESLVESI